MSSLFVPFFFFIFFLLIRLPPRSTLFPYTTLFRSVSRGRCTETFKCGAVGVSCLSRRLSPKVADFDFTRRESRTLIVREHTEVFRRDWTRTKRDYCAYGIGVCACISKAQDHSPRVSDHDKFLSVQLLAEGFDVFHVGVQIDRGRVIPWQLRSASSALFPHNASVFFSELVSNTLHGVDVFTRSAT